MADDRFAKKSENFEAVRRASMLLNVSTFTRRH